MNLKLKRLINGVSLVVQVTAFSLFGQHPTKTVEAFTKSIEREKAGDYFGAIKNILSLNDSNSYENTLRLGWLHYKAGHEKKALRYYRRAVAMKPEALEPRIGFGYPAYLLEDFDELIEQDKKILEIDPNEKNINSNLALVYYYNGEYEKALPYFRKALSLYPFDYENNLKLGWTYLKLNNNAKAEEYINIALLHTPGDASAKEAMENLGKPAGGTLPLIEAFTKSYYLSANSDNKGAAAELLKVYDKNNYFINLRLGWLTYLMGQHIESANYYKTAVLLKPESIEARLGSALPAEAMMNLNEAMQAYEGILVIDPKNTTANYKLGSLLYRKKEYDKALICFEKIVKLYPFSYDGLFMYAWTCYQVNKYEESRAMFYKVLCLSPGDQSATNALNLKPVEEQRKLEQKEIIRPR